MTENIMKEVVLIGKAKNIDFEQDIVEKTLQKAQNFPYETKKGDIFGGTLIRMAKEHNLAIPTITEIYGALMAP